MFVDHDDIVRVATPCRRCVVDAVAMATDRRLRIRLRVGRVLLLRRRRRRVCRHLSATRSAIQKVIHPVLR